MKPFPSKTRMRAVTATLGLLASVVVSLALSPGTAHANCAGTTETTGSLYVFGVVYGSEQPVSGTCNSNSYYQTYIQSSYPTWRTSLHVQNDGKWVHYYGGYDTARYYVDFTDNNSHSEINICVDNGTDWYCGWDRKYTFDTKWTDYYTHIMTGF
jgi:hypothetical protein